MLRDLWEKLLRNKILFAVANILLGIYMLFAGRGALYTVIRVIGRALIITAIAYVIMYFVSHRFQNAYQQEPMQLYYAGAAAVAGLLVLWLAPSLVNLFPVLAGLALIVTGIVNFTSVSQNGNIPFYAKLGPIVTIVLGAVILFHPGAVLNLAVTLAGIALILNGLSELDLIRRIW